MRITLEQKTFRALASEKRIKILKSLDERRKTLSELSKEFNMKPSSMKEQMDKLAHAGLVLLKDEGQKWKYYEITDIGKGILNPYEKTVMFLLTTTLVAAVGVAYLAIDKLFRFSVFARGEIMAAKSEDAIAAAPSNVTDLASGTASEIPYIEIAAAIILFLIAGILIGYIIKKKRLIGND